MPQLEEGGPRGKARKQRALAQRESGRPWPSPGAAVLKVWPGQHQSILGAC